MKNPLGLAFSTLLALTMLACSGPSGRLKSDSEEDMVGKRAPGAETYDRLVAGAVERLLSSEAAAMRSTGQMRIAVMPIENKSAEDLGDWRDQLFQVIGATINGSKRFRTINDRFLSAAFREARIEKDDIYTPRGRRALATALEQQGAPVDLLLFTTMTTGTTNAGQAESQRNYSMGLVLVDIATGDEVANVTAPRIRKEYSR